jgi:DNA-binding NarL/FixJ family response regulator
MRPARHLAEFAFSAPWGLAVRPVATPLSHCMSPTTHYALILDDHPLVAHGMAEFLRARMPQMDVVVASGPDDLLRWVHTRGTPAIALIDFWLTEGSAVGLIAQVRSQCPGTPIAVISGDDDPAVMERARQAGVQGFVHKQAAPDTFGLAVEALLSGLVWFEPGLPGSQMPRSRDLPVTPSELGLSTRQGQILELVLQGLPNKRIASQLDIAESTVKEHVTAILERLGVRTRVEAITQLRGRRLELS